MGDGKQAARNINDYIKNGEWPNLEVTDEYPKNKDFSKLAGQAT